MVNREQCSKLEAKGWKILYVGDPAQLPPVGEDTSPAFEYKTKYLMTEVVRQAADNPVTGIATMLRERIAEGASFTLADIAAHAVAGDQRLRKVSKAGSSLCSITKAAAKCMAVGNTSLEDCPRLTSSLGCSSRCCPRTPPMSSDARLASTSFMFIWVCVPEPVCQTESGNA